jgi:hypothetical protein
LCRLYGAISVTVTVNQGVIVQASGPAEYAGEQWALRHAPQSCPINSFAPACTLSDAPGCNATTCESPQKCVNALEAIHMKRPVGRIQLGPQPARTIVNVRDHAGPLPLPTALAAIAAGRDHILTEEYARATNRAPQTLRKNYCLTGEAFGVRPLKFGNRLLWPVSQVAALLNGLGTGIKLHRGAADDVEGEAALRPNPACGPAAPRRRVRPPTGKDRAARRTARDTTPRPA